MSTSTNAATFLQEASVMMGWTCIPSTSTITRTTNWRFQSAFGVNPLICHHIWILIMKNGALNDLPAARPKHLLWTLLFLKQYNSMELNASIVGVNKKNVP